MTMGILLATSLFTGCKSEKSGMPDLKTNEEKGVLAQFADPVEGQPVAAIQVKDYGEIKLMLFPKAAPKGVENFITHAKDGYYNGVKFHRVVEDFMIQGGDPKGDGTGGESIWDGKGFDVEYDGSLRNYTGALAYANAGPGTNGSQFFIVNAPKVSEDDFDSMSDSIKKQYGIDVDFPDEVRKKYTEVGGCPFLDGSYTVFGQVIEGLDVVEKIMETQTDWNEWGTEKSVPTSDVVIESITISEYAK